MDEKELKRLLKRARDYKIKSEMAERELFGYIAAHTDDIDLSDVEFRAENSDNLEEAFSSLSSLIISHEKHFLLFPCCIT